MQLIIDINEENKLNALLAFFKSFNIKVTQVINNEIAVVDESSLKLTPQQKMILDERRANTKIEDYITTEELDKQLVFKTK
ncbi:MAG: hypothetical protein ABL940_00620 [Bacteroidia bacterium]